ISNATGEIEKAELYNLLGEKVIAQRVTRSEIRLSMNTATLPSGIYLVAVYKTNGERMAAKVMVQRE
ncbi:MAG: T9SS type A sorting domain-containing protein, partial [Bacteroidia bacterium]|nr:T9SS type A sorting domain-containing protein [Bacteroidia bacterium]